MSDLLHGVALISGAGSGIGRATSLAFVRHGIERLALLDVDSAGLAESKELILALKHEVDVLEVKADLSTEEGIVQGIRKAVDTFGRIDIAVNNVGIGGAICPSAETDLSDYRKIINLNLTGLWLAQREQIRQMLKQELREQGQARPPPGIRNRGAIVNLSSTYGLVAPSASTPAPAYIASKHGILGMTKADATSYARDGIRINAICPGFVNTAALRAAVQQGGIMEQEMNKVPMGRFAEPAEIAEAISFLASPMSSYMTGASLVVDGGFLSQ